MRDWRNLLMNSICHFLDQKDHQFLDLNKRRLSRPYPDYKYLNWHEDRLNHNVNKVNCPGQ